MTYHDHKITGLSLLAQNATILLESPGGCCCEIDLIKVERLLAADFLQGNIIDHIDCHNISDEGVLRSVMEEFLEVKSQYYSRKIIEDLIGSGRCVGKLFVAIRPIYGVELYAIASSVDERRL
jgi:hypothetical protein